MGLARPTEKRQLSPPRTAPPGHDHGVSDLDELKSAVIDVLGTAVLDPEALQRSLAERGRLPADPDALRDVILSHPTFVTVADGLFHLPALLEGTTWTVWVDPDDADDDIVRVEPHLSPLAWWFVEEPVEVETADGQPLGEVRGESLWSDDREIDVVKGPEGWLAPFAGQWAAVAVVDSRLRWTVLSDAPDPDTTQAAAMKIGFSRSAVVEVLSRPGQADVVFRCVHGDDAVLEALAAGALGAAPVAPLPELYAAAGLVLRDTVVAPDDSDWATFEWWQPRQRLRDLFELDATQIEAVLTAVAACHLVGAPATDLDAVAAAFDEQAPSEALLAELLRLHVVPEDVADVLDALAGRLAGPLPLGLVRVLARANDMSGDGGRADALVQELLARHCEWKPVLLEAAAYASDRGDAVESYRLLGQAGVLATDLAIEEHFDPNWKVGQLLRREVQGFARSSRTRATVGRNDPCPCGSGRKYKVCHLGNEMASLEDRASWLYDKARRFLRTYFEDTLDEIGQAMVSTIEDEVPQDLMDELVASPFVADLALHELHLFDQFLGIRRSILPADEVTLAQRWLGAPRSLFAVTQIGRDQILLMDVRTDDQYVIESIQMSGDTPIGTMLVGRALPVGESNRGFGGFMTVPPEAVDEMLEVLATNDAFAIAAALGSLFGPLTSDDDHEVAEE